MYFLLKTVRKLLFLMFCFIECYAMEEPWPGYTALLMFCANDDASPGLSIEEQRYFFTLYSQQKAQEKREQENSPAPEKPDNHFESNN